MDRGRHPEHRTAVLSLVAFHELKKLGLDAFLSQNDGEGWMLPDTLCLADYGLGHDDRAREPQPVACALGPRFLDWQLEQDVEESWEECRRHAELINRIVPLPGTPSTNAEDEKAEGPTEAPQAQTDLFGNPIQTDLFGNPVMPRRRR